jgi:hypothetical protein
MSILTKGRNYIITNTIKSTNNTSYNHIITTNIANYTQK